ncbi:phosphatase PAP2 family protein [Aquihabitans daechungensis]|uniref:phosphatase PAP2 family protein n=1 Tax=Aquihabitans daechungensis TaxID=1052257 RepID=UPI003B9FDCE8
MPELAPPAPPSPNSRVDRLDEAADAAWGRVFRGHPLADRIFYLASELGDFSVIWLLLAAAEGVRSDEDADASIRLALLLMGESLLVNQGIKRLVRRPRPIHAGERPHNVRLPRTSSFPSGHASSAMAAAGMLSHRHPKAAPLYYGMAAVVATSRVHVKVHHVSDVLAGAAIGIAYAQVAKRIWPVRAR